VFPFALWVFSFIADLIFLARPDLPAWRETAYYTMAGGLIGAVLAAVPGLIDLISIRDRAVKRIGITHMVLNLSVVVLYAINLWLRTSDHAVVTTGELILSIVALILLGVSGWLGGEMVYVHGVGVSGDLTDAHRPADDTRRYAA